MIGGFQDNSFDLYDVASAALDVGPERLRLAADKCSVVAPYGPQTCAARVDGIP